MSKTCLEYVLENLTKTQQTFLKEALINKTFIKNKSRIKRGDELIFTHGFHVGFGTVTEYLDIITDECSDGIIFSRALSLHDDRLKVVAINPKRKRGKTSGETK